MKIIYFFLYLIPMLLHADESLTMNDYLEQVRTSHPGYKGSIEGREGAKLRASQSELLTSFTLEGDYQLKSDQKLSQNPAIVYDSVDTENYSIGIRKITHFGLDAKFSYELNEIKYVNPSVTPPGGIRTSTSTPTLTLTQPLWKNSFGRQLKSQIDVIRAQAEMDKYNAQSYLDTTIQKASMAYWGLVFQREIVEIQKAALKQAQAIYDYNTKRSNMNLADRADSLQSKATLETKKLDLQEAIDMEQIRGREFNFYRNHQLDSVVENLRPVNWDYILNLEMPKLRGDRADVKAARARAQMQVANAHINRENSTPSLNLFASYALNGRATSYNEAISESHNANRPTTVMGITFSIPLDIQAIEQTKSGALLQAMAADLEYKQKEIEQNANWRDLKVRLQTIQNRLKFSESIVNAQKEKLEYERNRLKNGRTSTYQVLLFEQDYINSQLTRVKNASELVDLISQIKLYDETYEGEK